MKQLKNSLNFRIEKLQYRFMLYMKKVVIIIFIFTLLSQHCLYSIGQNHFKNYSIQNFSKKSYKASNQNWSVDTSPNGYIYFANHWGLLEFDGISWELHKLPNETILRSVLVASDSLIYTSGYRELGYWLKDKNGKLHYHSLNRLAEKFFSINDESWNISKVNEVVYFHTFSKIYCYQNDSITPLAAPGSINTQHQIGNKMMIAVRDIGIYSIEGNHLEPYIVSSFFKNKIVRFFLPFGENQIMIGTNSDGIFIWDGKDFLPWSPEWTDYFKKSEVNRAIITEQGNVVVGTIINGVSIFDRAGSFISNYNTANGLQNNTILGIVSDKYNNIWLALDSGIGFLSANTPPGFSIEELPGIGSVYDAAFFENKIYLATNQGLFFNNTSQEKGNFKMVINTQGHIWDCQVVDDNLLIGHNDGIMLIKNGISKVISRQSGGFSLREDPTRNGYFIESTYSTMVSLKKENGSIVDAGPVNKFADLIRYIEFDHIGNLWASHMHRGVYKLQLSDLHNEVLSSNYYGSNSVFKKDHSIHVFKVENRIVFTTEEQLYTYDDLSDTIIPYNFLNENLNEFAKSHRIISAPDHHYWFISKEKLGLFAIANNEIKLIKSFPRSLFVLNELIDNYENILPLSATKAIVCLENGIAHIDASVNDSISEISSFVPHLREIKLTDRNGKISQDELSSDYIKVKYKYHNIQLRYSFPHYTSNPIYFKAFLQGIDQDWSPRTEIPNFSFDRLPPGKYELQVKASDQWGNESQNSKIQIEIAPPWFLSIYAKIGYILLFITILLGFRAWGIRKIRKKESFLHEKREKELIRLRNENLRTEVEHKSKELANSTISMVKKNEFLMELKELLKIHKDQLGSRYPDKYYFSLVDKIDMNISNQDDWKLFETNFERAHEQFLNKLKVQFQDLTPSDLKLSAFLRMNLSSKEIAPLLGISVRGVENHRYRLRKKLELDSDDNLTEFLMTL